MMYYTDLVAEVCVPPVRGGRHVLDHADELVRVQGGQRLGGGRHQQQQGQQLQWRGEKNVGSREVISPFCD